MSGDATVDATALGDTLTDDEPAASAHPQRGETIGRFVVLDVLGTGGMGVVYAAYDPHLDRKVALKVLRARVMESDEARTRLLREAQAMARIDHPNVLRVHEAGTFEDRIYIAMELAPEGTLKRWLDVQERSASEIVAMFVQAGRGLAAAHTAGLVHRDFKPDNALMFADGQVRVTDFGLVGVIGELPAERPPELDAPISDSTPLSQDLTRTGAMMGTPAYMAPEQFRGHNVGPAADQFAFCIALYEALYRQRPFAGATFAELCANVVSGELAPPPADSRVPARFQRIVARGLATDPERRFPTMNALVADLGRAPRRRLWLAIGGVAAIAVAATAYFALRPAPVAACSGAEARLAAVWNPALQVKLAHTLDASHLPEARGVLEHVVPLVERWSAAWQQAYVGACEDTRVRAIQSDHMLDLRMACLGRRLEDARAALDALAMATPAEALDHAIGIARALPDVKPCAETAALTAAMAPPATEAARRTALAIGDELGREHAQILLGHYRAGLELARHALDTARELGYRPAIAEALYAVGQAQDRLGDDRAAADAFRDAMYEATSAGATDTAIRAAAGRIDAISSQPAQQPLADELGRIATAMSERAPVPAAVIVDLHREIGALLEAEGHVPEAKARYEQALAIATTQLEPDNRLTVGLLSNLAILAAQAGRFEEARKMFEQIAAAEQRIYGPDHPEYATALDNLANIDAEQGKSADSKALREKALAIRIAALGPEHPSVATSYGNLGGIYAEAGDHQTAKLYFEKSIAAYRKAFGATSIEASHPLMNLAPSLYVLGDRAGARKAIEEALAIAEHTYPKDDRRLVGYLENAALIARDDDRLAEALADFQRVEQIVEKANGPDAAAAESLGYIALTYMVMGKLPEAQAACARSLTALEKVYGADSPYVGSALGDCGSVQLEQNDAVAALASYDKAKTLLEAKLGKDHSSVGHALSGRAKALVRLKRESEAITDVERALAIANSTKAGPGELAELHFTLAMALSAKPATRARARDEANVAIAGYEKADDKRALAKARGWLRTH